MSDLRSEDLIPGIAIVGMAARVPGARTIDAFWRNLMAGVESVKRFTQEELEAAGVDPSLLANPNYVRANGVLDDVESFDAAFFGYSPREAELMDPQHRVFLETVWEALEHAGCDAERYPGAIGVFAGTGINGYLLNLLSDPELLSAAGTLKAIIGNDKDHVSTRVAYKLNLHGPSVTVQTACSTSLVAVHLACQALHTYQCDAAVAGGVGIAVPHHEGYLFQEGSITSRDGHCRPFDARADGTIGGSGAGAVVLKRFDEAIEDGDTVYAVIRGSAVNNDGNRKIGYTAPSVQGQAEVIAMAHEAAGVDPASISYVEAHGTGTTLGDPIEIEALTQAFGDTVLDGPSCAIGSVKASIGHLDAAAGVVGLIKTVLMLRHRRLVPSVNYESPNPRIDFSRSPFVVNTVSRAWEGRGGVLRAGVSSFGIGGTNAHVVLEEAERVSIAPSARDYHILPVSARSVAALDKATANLGAFLSESGADDIADIAHTLQNGRRQFPYRRAVLCRDAADAVRILDGEAAGRVVGGFANRTGSRIVFLFPGQGSQYWGMGRALYDAEPFFRTTVDAQADVLRRDLGVDVLPALLGSGEAELSAPLTDTEIVQPSLFVLEYALAQLLMRWGITPDIMLGHSLGEYVAACLAGVFTLEDALRLVAMRGRLMSQLPPGAMLAVGMSERDAERYATEGVSIAAINSRSSTVLSGPLEEIAVLEARMRSEGIFCKRLETSHAFHSEMVQPAVRELTSFTATLALRDPRMPFVSNLTGIRAGAEVTQAPYWGAHLRERVRFADGVATVLEHKDSILLEVGPGSALTQAVRQNPDTPADAILESMLPRERECGTGTLQTMRAVARLWAIGVEVRCRSSYEGEQRRTVGLPTYPFERQRFWLDRRRIGEGSATATALPGHRLELSKWSTAPVWKQAPPRAATSSENTEALLFFSAGAFGHDAVETLRARGREVIVVQPGEGFGRRADGTYMLSPTSRDDYSSLVRSVRAEKGEVPPIVFCWSSLGNASEADSVTTGSEECYLPLIALTYLAQALGETLLETAVRTRDLELTVVTEGIYDVIGDEALVPAQSLALGPCLAIPKEYPGIRCRNVDVSPARSGVDRALVQNFAEELLAGEGADPIALRRSRRWIRELEEIDEPTAGSNDQPRLRSRGVYLVTGAFGGIGSTLARFLAETVNARLVLVGRGLAAAHESAGRADLVRSLEEVGAETLVVTANLEDPLECRRVVERARERFGRVDGVIHAAGVPPQGLLAFKTPDEISKVAAVKTLGLEALAAALDADDLDFFVLCSSLSSLMGSVGGADYSAANAYMDVFAHRHASRFGGRLVSVNWDRWREVGMGASLDEGRGVEGGADRAEGIAPGEGIAIFKRVLASARPQISVSVVDLPSRLARNRRESASSAAARAAGVRTLHARPALGVPWSPARSETEAALVRICSELLGIAEIGVHDDLFELGGDSVTAIQIAARGRDVGIVLSPQDLFANPTIAGLAARADESEADAAAVPPVASTSTERKAIWTEDAYPLSSFQKSLLFHTLYESGGGTYFEQLSCTLRGPLDVAAFKRSWQLAVEGHAILRTSFQWDSAEEPFQRVHRDVSVPWVDLDWRDCDEPEREAGLERFLAEDRRAGFDVTRAPLLRFALVRLADKEYRFVWSFHHLVLDGWSIGIVIDDVFGTYSSLRVGLEPRPITSTPYREYIAWLEARTTEPSSAFWRAMLGSWRGSTPLPLARTGASSERSSGFADVRRRLSPELSRDLGSFARSNGVTLNSLAQAAWALVLAHSAKSEDVLFGATFSGRPPDLKGLERMVGVFINTLPVRVAVDRAASVREFVRAVHQRQVEIQRFQYDGLADVRRWAGVPGGSALFDSIVVVQNYPLQSSSQSRSIGLEIDRSDFIVPNSLPLTLHVFVQGAEIWLQGLYDARDFERLSVERVLEVLAQTLGTLISGWSSSVQDVLASIARIEGDLRAHERSRFATARHLKLKSFLQSGPG